jgi:hypothetical protein
MIIKANSSDPIDPQELATYVDTLKLYEKSNNVEEPIKSLIKELPPSSTIIKYLSLGECEIVFESVQYAWETLSGNKIKPHDKMEETAELLEGNYWILLRGIMLRGINHFTIVKQNLTLFAHILNVSGMVLQQELSLPPQHLIGTIIMNGGIRVHVDNNILYAQLTDTTYNKWGKDILKKLSTDTKHIKVIDRNSEYKGWQDGIEINKS